MNKPDLTEAVSNFQALVKTCGPLCRAGNAVSRVLCELYLTRGAFLIETYMRSIDVALIGPALDRELLSVGSFNVPKLPDEEAVRCAGKDLLDATGSGNPDVALRALAKMGVIERCHPAERQLSRMDLLGGSMTGRARLIFLIDLSIFAIELGLHGRATNYIIEARNLSPDASELHDINTVDGIIALSAGDMVGSIRYLKDSIHVCSTDEYACLLCGIRAPNTILLEKLLECGERQIAVEFLSACKVVWDRHVDEISVWIDAIQRDQRPELLTSGFLGVMNQPSARLAYLCTTAQFPERTTRTAPARTPEELMAKRKSLLADYREVVTRAVHGKLGSEKN